MAAFGGGISKLMNQRLFYVRAIPTGKTMPCVSSWLEGRGVALPAGSWRDLGRGVAQNGVGSCALSALAGLHARICGTASRHLRVLAFDIAEQLGQVDGVQYTIPFGVTRRAIGAHKSRNQIICIFPFKKAQDLRDINRVQNSIPGRGIARSYVAFQARHQGELSHFVAGKGPTIQPHFIQSGRMSKVVTCSVVVVSQMQPSGDHSPESTGAETLLRPEGTVEFLRVTRPGHQSQPSLRDLLFLRR